MDYLSAPVNTEKMKNVRTGNRGFHTVLCLVLIRISLSKDITSGDILSTVTFHQFSCACWVFAAKTRLTIMRISTEFDLITTKNSSLDLLNVRWKINKNVNKNISECLLHHRKFGVSVVSLILDRVDKWKRKRRINEWMDDLNDWIERMRKWRKYWKTSDGWMLG